MSTVLYNSRENRDPVIRLVTEGKKMAENSSLSLFVFKASYYVGSDNIQRGPTTDYEMGM